MGNKQCCGAPTQVADGDRRMSMKNMKAKRKKGRTESQASGLDSLAQSGRGQGGGLGRLEVLDTYAGSILETAGAEPRHMSGDTVGSLIGDALATRPADLHGVAAQRWSPSQEVSAQASSPKYSAQQAGFDGYPSEPGRLHGQAPDSAASNALANRQPQQPPGPSSFTGMLGQGDYEQMKARAQMRRQNQGTDQQNENQNGGTNAQNMQNQDQDDHSSDSSSSSSSSSADEEDEEPAADAKGTQATKEGQKEEQKGQESSSGSSSSSQSSSEDSEDEQNQQKSGNGQQQPDQPQKSKQDEYLEESSETSSGDKDEPPQQSVEQRVEAKKEEERPSARAPGTQTSALRQPTPPSRDPTPERNISSAYHKAAANSTSASANNLASANNRPSATADQPRKYPQDKQITPERPSETSAAPEKKSDFTAPTPTRQLQDKEPTALKSSQEKSIPAKQTYGQQEVPRPRKEIASRSISSSSEDSEKPTGDNREATPDRKPTQDQQGTPTRKPTQNNEAKLIHSEEIKKELPKQSINFAVFDKEKKSFEKQATPKTAQEKPAATKPVKDEPTIPKYQREKPVTPKQLPAQQDPVKQQQIPVQQQPVGGQQQVIEEVKKEEPISLKMTNKKTVDTAKNIKNPVTQHLKVSEAPAQQVQEKPASPKQNSAGTLTSKTGDNKEIKKEGEKEEKNILPANHESSGEKQANSKISQEEPPIDKQIQRNTSIPRRREKQPSPKKIEDKQPSPKKIEDKPTTPKQTKELPVKNLIAPKQKMNQSVILPASLTEAIMVPPNPSQTQEKARRGRSPTTETTAVGASVAPPTVQKQTQRDSSSSEYSNSPKLKARPAAPADAQDKKGTTQVTPEKVSTKKAAPKKMTSEKKEAPVAPAQTEITAPLAKDTTTITQISKKMSKEQLPFVEVDKQSQSLENSTDVNSLKTVSTSANIKTSSPKSNQLQQQPPKEPQPSLVTIQRQQEILEQKDQQILELTKQVNKGPNQQPIVEKEDLKLKQGPPKKQIDAQVKVEAKEKSEPPKEENKEVVKEKKNIEKKVPIVEQPAPQTKAPKQSPEKPKPINQLTNEKKPEIKKAADKEKTTTELKSLPPKATDPQQQPQKPVQQPQPQQQNKIANKMEAMMAALAEKKQKQGQNKDNTQENQEKPEKKETPEKKEKPAKPTKEKQTTSEPSIPRIQEIPKAPKEVKAEIAASDAEKKETQQPLKASPAKPPPAQQSSLKEPEPAKRREIAADKTNDEQQAPPEQIQEKAEKAEAAKEAIKEPIKEPVKKPIKEPRQEATPEKAKPQVEQKEANNDIPYVIVTKEEEKQEQKEEQKEEPAAELTQSVMSMQSNVKRQMADDIRAKLVAASREKRKKQLEDGGSDLGRSFRGSVIQQSKPAFGGLAQSMYQGQGGRGSVVMTGSVAGKAINAERQRQLDSLVAPESSTATAKDKMLANLRNGLQSKYKSKMMPPTKKPGQNDDTASVKKPNSVAQALEEAMRQSVLKKQEKLDMQAREDDLGASLILGQSIMIDDPEPFVPVPAEKEDKQEEKQGEKSEEKALPNYYSKMNTMMQDKIRERSKSPQAVDQEQPEEKKPTPSYYDKIKAAQKEEKAQPAQPEVKPNLYERLAQRAAEKAKDPDTQSVFSQSSRVSKLNDRLAAGMQAKLAAAKAARSDPPENSQGGTKEAGKKTGATADLYARMAQRKQETNRGSVINDNASVKSLYSQKAGQQDKPKPNMKDLYASMKKAKETGSTAGGDQANKGD